MKTRILAFPLLMLAACSKDDAPPPQPVQPADSTNTGDTTHVGIQQNTFRFAGKFCSYEISYGLPASPGIPDSAYQIAASVKMLPGRLEFALPVYAFFHDRRNPRNAAAPASLDAVRFVAYVKADSNEYALSSSGYRFNNCRLSASKDTIYFRELDFDGGLEFREDHQFTGIRTK